MYILHKYFMRKKLKSKCNLCFIMHKDGNVLNVYLENNVKKSYVNIIT